MPPAAFTPCTLIPWHTSTVQSSCFTHLQGIKQWKHMFEATRKMVINELELTYIPDDQEIHLIILRRYDSVFLAGTGYGKSPIFEAVTALGGKTVGVIIFQAALALTCAAEAYLLDTTVTVAAVIPLVKSQRDILTSLLHIQRVDYDRYATVQLDDFGGALLYFEDLAGYLCHVGVRPMFRCLGQLEDAEGELQTRIHDIARGAAETIHGILSASKGEEVVKR
ncbi:hypothetical protein DFH07DRAFT_959475 [Mycena maculata]|uniref:Uncharacterized protein n=1 Tax=Mycena maculata TaxID=230809 RepID=A0AAD7J424_9AGAR|nr:hypothetical protein DFH07DRAFT_959475 [Mycena maculata]